MIENITNMMTPEQRLRLSEEPAWANMNRPMGFPLGATPFQFTGHFHQVMGLPAPEVPILPPVSMRERRLRLIAEEFQELCDAAGFQIMIGQAPVRFDEELTLSHIEGSHYDVVETADALGDLNVVVNGTAVEYGIPMHFIDYEVYCSNLSKLDAEGKPIVNHCRKCGPNLDNVYYSTCECGHAGEWLKPDAPIGKILKPDGFVTTNIPRVLLAHEKREI